MDKKTANKGNNGNKRLSLYPLKFEDAVKDLLKVKPEANVKQGKQDG